MGLDESFPDPYQYFEFSQTLCTGWEDSEVGNQIRQKQFGHYVFSSLLPFSLYVCLSVSVCSVCAMGVRVPVCV